VGKVHEKGQRQMIRRFGNSPKAGQTYRTRAGAYAVLPLNGQLLLTFQAGIFDEYQLPGGGIDAGESPIAALHREVFEETGWKIAAPRRIGAFRRFTYMPDYDLWAEKICTIYVATPVLRLGPPSEADHTAVWMTPEMAQHHLCNAGDRHFVEVFNG